ncbi:MAG: transcriptional regulator [Sulfuricurvum sp. PC08-66]|nr:MAG: transcriptional regulator [Sulfuricurvum sp. PC08-66]
MALKLSSSHNPKYDRLSYIYERIARTPDGVTIKELTQELEVSSKTLQRDLHETLASSGIYCEGRRWKLNHKSSADGLGSQERIVLGVLDSLAKQAGLDFYHKAHQLLEQISSQLEHPLFANMDTEALSKSHLETFVTLERAIKSRTMIHAHYTSVRKAQTQVHLKPIRLAFFAGFWYVLAFDANDDDTFKKYHLKSLTHIVLTDEHYEIDPSVIARIEEASSVWFSLDEPFEVRLWIDAEVAPYFQRKPLRTQRLMGQDGDGSIEVALRITHEMEILPLVLWYLPHIRILSPKWLDKALDKKIEAYKKG